MEKKYLYYESNINNLFKRYFELNKNDPIEMGQFINELCMCKDQIQTKVHIAFAKDLLDNGFLSSKEFDSESSYMQKYNSVEQFFKLDEDVDLLSNCLVSRYINSIKIFGRPSDYVAYLSNVFCDRFIKYRNVDKITLLKHGKTYIDYIKK
ncbi:MAG: hypothetical protein IKO49_07645 [Bacilli bacterium]|nr:hypothetical protein [Bacilli bacterium]